MSTVDQISSTGSTSSALARAGGTDLMGDTQERFLTLLITQLKNQDPLNPMDNSQVTSQIAQLSTVSGIQQLNNTLLALSGQMDMSQSLQASGLIGKDILYPGNRISLGTDPSDPSARGATPFGIDIMKSAEVVEVSILDDSGKLVRKLELGALEAGIYPLSWDGLDDSGVAAPDGAYRIQIAASTEKGEPVAADTLTHGSVNSVAFTTEGLRLNLARGDKITLLDVRQVM